MTTVLPDPLITTSPGGRGYATGSHFGVGAGVARLPTDPLFYADLTLENTVVGSRYRVTRASNGEELATGVAAGTTVALAGVPVYANPMLVNITVRKASGSPNYRVFDTSVYLARGGASAYILQQLDE